MPYPAGQAPLIGSTRLPLNLEDAGRYEFIPSYRNERTGQGTLIQVGLPQVEWSWNYVSKSDFAALVALSAPGYSKVLTGTNAARVWDDTQVLKSYSFVVVDRPVYEEYSGGLFREVTLRLSQLR